MMRMSSKKQGTKEVDVVIPKFPFANYMLTVLVRWLDLLHCSFQEIKEVQLHGRPFFLLRFVPRSQGGLISVFTIVF